MQNPLERIKQRVLGKQSEDLFTDVDIFMHEYGMSLQEFKQLPIPAFFLLREKIIKRYEMQNKSIKKKGRR